MREARRHSLVEVDQEKHLARVVRDGKVLDFVVAGVILEAQFDLADGSSLLWLTEDSPYDEGLHVYLIGRGGELEDALEAGATFAPGLLEIRATGEDWVRFAFFRNEREYRLEVGPRARFRMFQPLGWRYPRRLARHRLAVHSLQKGSS